MKLDKYRRICRTNSQILKIFKDFQNNFEEDTLLSQSPVLRLAKISLDV